MPPILWHVRLYNSILLTLYFQDFGSSCGRRGLLFAMCRCLGIHRILGIGRLQWLRSRFLLLYILNLMYIGPNSMVGIAHASDQQSAPSHSTRCQARHLDFGRSCASHQFLWPHSLYHDVYVVSVNPISSRFFLLSSLINSLCILHSEFQTRSHRSDSTFDRLWTRRCRNCCFLGCGYGAKGGSSFSMSYHFWSTTNILCIHHQSPTKLQNLKPYNMRIPHSDTSSHPIHSLSHLNIRLRISPLRLHQPRRELAQTRQ